METSDYKALWDRSAKELQEQWERNHSDTCKQIDYSKPCPGIGANIGCQWEKPSVLIEWEGDQSG